MAEAQKEKENDIEEVKSTAIVKYSNHKPAQFTRLQCNTDLNLPPSNWLSSAGDSYGFQHVKCHTKGFSSFKMAHTFPDCICEVDVVSDAENIKKLLKIPYHKGHISMVVHRVGKTVLVDELDISKHLVKTAKSEYNWMRKFFFENINAKTFKEDRLRYINNRRSEALKQKSLVSKFLYHSLVESELSESGHSEHVEKKPVQVHGPLLPEPLPSQEMPPLMSGFNHQFNRNIVWTFEDIEMLLGTDLPIFGGGTYPCISLRLRDMNKPINVLTGIDYWLDNLMSNVPEVVMCYHLNGIVQKYEFIKTEDLPHLEDSKFSPKLIRDVAKSILSFLKSNATQAGHTYWLFKGKDEEVIKLYDLTSLCSETDVEKDQNPFTIPVAMLLYRVAKNMKASSERSHSESDSSECHRPGFSERHRPGTVRMLLKNCIKLLSEEKYPEIVTSSHYMLADLFIPADTNPQSPGSVQKDNEDTESVYDDDDYNESNQCSAVKTLVLNDVYNNQKFVDHPKHPPPITSSVEERCLQAILHVASGINCLQYFSDEAPKEGIFREEEMKTANPHEAIPMPDPKLSESSEKAAEKQKKPSKKEKRRKKAENETKERTVSGDNKTGALLLKNKNEAQPLLTWQTNLNMNDICWKEHLKTLLYEKASLVYATLSEQHYLSGNFGSSLRTIGLLARCKMVMNKLVYTSNSLVEYCLLSKAGDCLFKIFKNWTKSDIYREQYRNLSIEDLKMMEQLEKDLQFYSIQIGYSNMKCVFLYDIRTTDQMLLKGLECYEEALKLSDSDINYRKLGNCLNEVGTYYLSMAKQDQQSAIDYCKKAEHYLARGLEIFEKVKDKANTALLYNNTGHLHRLQAHICSIVSASINHGEISVDEKIYFNKALVSYKKALVVLGSRTENPLVWDAVNFEMSSAAFTLACAMHDHPPAKLEKSEDYAREVLNALHSALKCCDFDEKHDRYPFYQYRGASIYYRIASLYHSQLRSPTGDIGNPKNIIQLAKINYKKAADLYLQATAVTNYLRAQMEHFALLESLAETSTGNVKLRHLQSCLSLLLETDELIKQLDDKSVDIPEEEDESVENGDEKKSYKTCLSLLNLVRKKLQEILRNILQLCIAKPAHNKGCPELENLYKSCYRISLFPFQDSMTCSELVKILHSVMTRIKVEIDKYH